MAALRIFARTAISAIRAPPIAGDSRKNVFAIANQVQKRWATTTLGFGEKLKVVELPEFEVSKDPKEWAYVERCLRPKIIPKPPMDVTDLPSGWKPPDAAAKNHPYFIERTKNHMMPVYLRRKVRGMQRITHVRRIQGDIMLLEKELREYIEARKGKKIGSQINEPAGLIKFRGDFVSHCLRFLESKGF